MALSMRHIVWFSATLSLGSFLYVLAIAPMEGVTGPHALESDRGVYSRRDLIAMTRNAIAQGQLMGADRAANRLINTHPNDPEAVFYRAIVDRELGREAESVAYFGRLGSMLEGRDASSEFDYTQSLDYLRAWSRLGVGAVREGQAMFARLSDDLEAQGGPIELTGTQSGTRSGPQSETRPDVPPDPRHDPESSSGRVLGSVDQYNLACYRALAGQPERALEHWRRAVELGYGRSGGDRGWWKSDPDLQSLTGLPEFWAIAEPLINDRRGKRDGRNDSDALDPQAQTGTEADADIDPLADPAPDISAEPEPGFGPSGNGA